MGAFSKGKKMMLLRENKILAQNITVADGLWSRMKGLLGKKRLSKGDGLLLSPCTSVHTFFMKFPIDVIFLDRNNKVIRLYKNLKPNRLTQIHFRAKKAIEFSAGMANKWKLAEGHTLKLRKSNV